MAKTYSELEARVAELEAENDELRARLDDDENVPTGGYDLGPDHPAVKSAEAHWKEIFGPHGTPLDLTLAELQRSEAELREYCLKMPPIYR